MKKIAFAAVALLFGISAFAEVKYQFYNKVFSDTLTVRHVAAKHNGADGAPVTGFAYDSLDNSEIGDEKAHNNFECLGVSNRVYAEIKTDKTDAMVKATFTFNDYSNDSDYGLKWTGYVDDWYVEYRPWDFLTAGFHDNIYMQGSYLPIYDDNLYSGNIGSEGVTVVFRPTALKNALRIAATVPFTTNLNWVRADKYLREDGSKIRKPRWDDTVLVGDTREYKYYDKGSKTFKLDSYLSDLYDYNTIDDWYRSGTVFNTGIGAIYSVEYFEAGVTIQDIFDKYERTFGTYVAFPGFFGVVKGLTVGGGIAHTKAPYIHNFDKQSTFNDYTYFGGVNGDTLFSAYGSYKKDKKFEIDAELVWNGGINSIEIYRDDGALKGLVSTHDFYTAASFKWWLSNKLSAKVVGKLVVDTDTGYTYRRFNKFFDVYYPVDDDLKNIYGAEFKLNYQMTAHNEFEVGAKTEYHDGDFITCFPVFWKYTF